MTYEVHFYLNDIEDFVVIEGQTVQVIRDKTAAWFAERGIEGLVHDIWSVEVRHG